MKRAEIIPSSAPKPLTFGARDMAIILVSATHRYCLHVCRMMPFVYVDSASTAMSATGSESNGRADTVASPPNGPSSAWLGLAGTRLSYDTGTRIQSMLLPESLSVLPRDNA